MPCYLWLEFCEKLVLVTLLVKLSHFGSVINEGIPRMESSILSFPKDAPCIMSLSTPFISTDSSMYFPYCHITHYMYSGSMGYEYNMENLGPAFLVTVKVSKRGKTEYSRDPSRRCHSTTCKSASSRRPLTHAEGMKNFTQSISTRCLLHIAITVFIRSHAHCAWT